MAFVVLIGLVIAAVIAGGYLAGIYNQLVQVKVNVDKSWANIEVLEKQRYDEIPKLVKVCEGYMQYERGTLEKVIAARSSFLQANANFVQLQSRVSALESEIADRREFYNESVTINNARIQQFPYVFLAGTLSMTQREMYKIAPAEKEPPEIKFAMPAA